MEGHWKLGLGGGGLNFRGVGRVQTKKTFHEDYGDFLEPKILEYSNGDAILPRPAQYFKLNFISNVLHCYILYIVQIICLKV